MHAHHKRSRAALHARAPFFRALLCCCVRVSRPPFSLPLDVLSSPYVCACLPIDSFRARRRQRYVSFVFFVGQGRGVARAAHTARSTRGSPQKHVCCNARPPSFFVSLSGWSRLLCVSRIVLGRGGEKAGSLCVAGLMSLAPLGVLCVKKLWLKKCSTRRQTLTHTLVKRKHLA